MNLAARCSQRKLLQLLKRETNPKCHAWSVLTSSFLALATGGNELPCVFWCEDDQANSGLPVLLAAVPAELPVSVGRATLEKRSNKFSYKRGIFQLAALLCSWRGGFCW